MRPPVQINETNGIAHHTSPLRTQDKPRLAYFIAVMKKYLINWVEWDFYVRDGSLTLQRKTDNRIVIKGFVDVDGKLCARPELQVPVSLQKVDNIVVGIELTHLDPYDRDALRDRLKADFSLQYCDPRSGALKVWLQPISDHFYDIVVLPDGYCLDIKQDEVDEIIALIDSLR